MILQTHLLAVLFYLALTNATHYPRSIQPDFSTKLGNFGTVAHVTVHKPYDDSRNFTDILYDLHWLPIESRIGFKLVISCFMSHRLSRLLSYESSPIYLAYCLRSCKPMRTLRTSNPDQLTVPASRIKLPSRTFSAASLQM